MQIRVMASGATPARWPMANRFLRCLGHDGAIGRLSEAAATDPEFAQAIDARIEHRRRKALAVLVERVSAKGARAKTSAMPSI